MQHYTVYFIWKLLYMFRVVPPPIIRSANNCIYTIWYLSQSAHEGGKVVSPTHRLPLPPMKYSWY